jgi:hypothetical protein
VNDGTFKIGEIAIFQNLPFPFDHLNNQEAKIIEGLQHLNVVDIFGTTAKKLSYTVFAANREFACQPANLKKKLKKAAENRELELEGA